MTSSNNTHTVDAPYTISTFSRPITFGLWNVLLYNVHVRNAFVQTAASPRLQKQAQTSLSGIVKCSFTTDMAFESYTSLGNDALLLSSHLTTTFRSRIFTATLTHYCIRTASSVVRTIQCDTWRPPTAGAPRHPLALQTPLPLEQGANQRVTFIMLGAMLLSTTKPLLRTVNLVVIAVEVRLGDRSFTTKTQPLQLPFTCFVVDSKPEVRAKDTAAHIGSLPRWHSFLAPTSCAHHDISEHSLPFFVNDAVYHSCH